MQDAEGRQTGSRLDELLVARGLAATRSRARDAVLRGTVRVDGKPAAKPGQAVSASSSVTVDDPASSYVSRAALKLIAGLDAFGLDPAGRVALDVGASTGGFTQVLLERGATRVVALDVGHGQLHPTLAADPRVTSLEGVNARDLTLDMIGGVAPKAIVCDVSFISLRIALPPALALAAPGAFAVLLVKPQFEVGREFVGKGGMADPQAALRMRDEMPDWLRSQPGWRCLGMMDSPILGGDGNREYLLAGICDR